MNFSYVTTFNYNCTGEVWKLSARRLFFALYGEIILQYNKSIYRTLDIQNDVYLSKISCKGRFKINYVNCGPCDIP